MNEAAEIIQSAADTNANIIFGSVIDEGLSDEVRVTVIATGFDRGRPSGAGVVFDVERPSRAGERGERTGPRRRDVVMDDSQRSSLEISDDDIDIPPFLRD